MKLKDLVNIRTLEYHWDVIESIPEFAKLKGTLQNPRWHSEGDAWEHTKRVCNEAIRVCQEHDWQNEPNYASFLLGSALFHDIGKICTTEMGKDGNWHSYGHEMMSDKLTRLILWDEDINLRETICALCKWHMEVFYVSDHSDYLERIINLSNNVNGYFNILTYLKQCDIRGSIQNPDDSKKDLAKLNDIDFVAYQLKAKYNRTPIVSKRVFDRLYNKKDRQDGRVIMMIGLSGAGKSTAISAENIGTDDYVVISRDTIRAELGYCKPGQKVVCSDAEEKNVSKLFNDRLVEAIKNGKTVVLDNLNIKRKYRDGYKNVLKDYNIVWDYIYVQASTLDKNIERRADSGMDIYKFKDMIKGIDWPTSDECDSLTIITT